MFDLDNWQEIWTTISRNKVRSLLTGFGVFWGIFMLIVLIGIGNGFKGGMLQVVNGFAANSCFFYTDLTGEAYKGFRKGRRWQMNTKDIALIREKSIAVDEISPILFSDRLPGKNVVRGRKTGSYDTRGVYPAHFRIDQQQVVAGRLINDFDIQEKRKVCVLGKEVYETLFDIGEDPIGQNIRVNGIYFQVIGVINPLSQIQIGGRTVSTVFVPFTTQQQTFSRGDAIHLLACTAKAGYPASLVEEEVKAIIKNAHDISPVDEKAMGSFNIEKEFQIYQNLFVGVDILIWIVGLGALFSGIIGISNIMLVTVRERMKEIGVRRALGASPFTIIKQIISESFMLTALAGLMGFLLGVWILEAVRGGMAGNVSEDMMFIPPFVSFRVALIALFILICSGIIAGIMPAMKALQIKAIDAIRDE